MARTTSKVKYKKHKYTHLEKFERKLRLCIKIGFLSVLKEAVCQRIRSFYLKYLRKNHQHFQVGGFTCGLQLFAPFVVLWDDSAFWGKCNCCCLP